MCLRRTTKSTLNQDLVPFTTASKDKDAKFSAFNERLITRVRAYWPAGKFSWKVGPFRPQTALDLFQSHSILSTHPQQDASFFPHYFSSAGSNPGVYGFNVKEGGSRTRWGYSFAAKKSWGNSKPQLKWRITVLQLHNYYQVQPVRSVELTEMALATKKSNKDEEEMKDNH